MRFHVNDFCLGLPTFKSKCWVDHFSLYIISLDPIRQCAALDNVTVPFFESMLEFLGLESQAVEVVHSSVDSLKSASASG